MPETRDWLTTLELAKRAKVSPETVRYWRATGTGPRGHRLGRHVRYLLDDVVRWEDARADRPRSAAR